MSDEFLLLPPNSLTVLDGRHILYAADGTPLKRQIGFAMQTTGTNPPLSDNTARRPPKGGKKMHPKGKDGR